MKKLKAKYAAPVDWLLKRHESIVGEFVGQFLRACETGDESAFERVAEIGLTAHVAAKRFEKELTPDERTCTNAMVYLLNGLHRGDIVEPEPAAEPKPAE
jgi:hypothetical protein